MKTNFILLLSLISVFAKAQDKTPELITDRPDQTESSAVVPHKFLQIETGFVMENKEIDLLSEKTFAYNTTLLRYGLLENFELRLGLEYLGSETKNSDTTNPLTGLGPLYTGFKVYITEEEGWKPEIALLGGMILPFTANEDFEPKYSAANFSFSFSHTLSDWLSIGYNLGAEWDGESEIPGYFYTLAVGAGITDKLGVFIEGFGLIPEEGDTEHLFDAGLTYLVLANFQLDLSGGIGLNDNSVDNFISFGLTYRIPN